MSKFVIECPHCGKFAEARTGFFARKKIDCACGYTIDVRTDRIAARECPHCGNTVVFDQAKGENAKCPVCRQPINTMAEQTRMEEFSCKQCGVRLRTAVGTARYVCPVCDFENDVQERLTSEKIRKDGLASIIKYEGDNETLVWKHPIEDFNLGSQLIVHESQEAVFFRDGQALCVCDEIGLGHSSYYSDPDENGVVLFGGHMGYAWAQRLRLEGNGIRSEDLYEDDLNARLAEDPEADYVYPGDVIPGSVYLPLFRMALRLPLEKLDEIEENLSGRFPGAAADIVFSEEELALYERLIASNDVVIAVSADGYTNSPGPIGFQELLRQDAAADYMTGDLSIQSAQPADLNGDGKPEYVLFLSTADDINRFCCCLHEQDGTVYAYLFSYYAPDAAVDSNGNLYFAAEYYQELYRLIFDGEEALTLTLPPEYYMP